MLASHHWPIMFQVSLIRMVMVVKENDLRVKSQVFPTLKLYLKLKVHIGFGAFSPLYFWFG